MTTRRLWRIGAAAAAVVAAAAAGVALNLALLGYAQPRNDPVGKLSPRVAGPQATAPATTQAPTVPVVVPPPATTTPEGGGHGRGGRDYDD